MAFHSAPFKFTETGSVLIRTGREQQPQSASKGEEVRSLPKTTLKV